MLVIKIKNRRIKVFNLSLLIIMFLIIIYALGSLFFMIPIFSKTYNITYKKTNYVLKEKTRFKNAWLKCNIKQEYKIESKNKLVKEVITKDLLELEYKKKGNRFVKKTSSFGICKNEKYVYEQEHKKNNVEFSLIGKDNINIEYGQTYLEEYVDAKINGKSSKNVKITSNLNDKQVGNYIIKYHLPISNNYNEFLYRQVNVVDNETPVITLSGDSEIYINYDENYIEPGYNAVDNYDGNLTNKVVVTNKVNKKKPGTYKISYSVSDSSKNNTKVYRTVVVREKEEKVTKEGPIVEDKDGLTYVNGILIVNKTYALPSDYNPGVNEEALRHLKEMQADAKILGYDLSLLSGFRSYTRQTELYNNYVKKDGEEKASMYSAKPGHSEHQTGLAFDIGRLDESFGNTKAGKWLEENAHTYGFIIRYPKGKSDITGYVYEPWHVRYLGIDLATKVKQSNLTLEEYLGLK